MMINKHFFIGMAAAIAVLAQDGQAQQPQAQVAKPLKTLPAEATVAVTLRDGSTVYGTLVRQDGDSVIVQAAMGRMAFAVASIRQLRPAGTVRTRADGTTEYWFPNANTTRLFFGPTGRTLGRGEGYFADHYVILASLGYGVTDRVQMGVGTFIIPNTQFWFLMPKVGVYQSELLNVAVGALYGGVADETGGIAYAVGTYGSTDRSVTLGIGQGISGAETTGKPLFMVGGELRTTRRTALVSENYFGTASRDGLLSYGVRFLGEKFTFDLGFLNSSTGPLFPGIPYVDFVIKW